MKKFLFLASLLVFTATQVEVKAQTKKPVIASVQVGTDTTSNTDATSLTFTEVGSNVVSFQATVTRLSGTITTATVLLQATNDGVNWVTVKGADTLSISSLASGSASLLWAIDKTHFTSYRAYYAISAGTQTSVLKFTMVRRPDEN
jgi:hypothetical protein